MKEQSDIGSTKKRKRHSPDPAKLNFDKTGLLAEIRSLTEGSKVNYIL